MGVLIIEEQGNKVCRETDGLQCNCRTTKCCYMVIGADKMDNECKNKKVVLMSWLIALYQPSNTLLSSLQALNSISHLLETPPFCCHSQFFQSLATLLETLTLCFRLLATLLETPTLSFHYTSVQSPTLAHLLLHWFL